MPKYRITSPDGKTFEITAPEGATQEQVLSYAQSQWKAPQTEKAPAQKDDVSALAAPFVGLSKGIGNAMFGGQELVGKGLSAIGADGIGQALIEDAAKRKLSEQENIAPYKEQHPMLTGGGELGGELLATAPIGGLLAKGASMIPGATKVAPALIDALRTSGMSAAGQTGAKALATRAAGGAITGGASASMLNPEDATAGAAIGSALPLVGKALQGVGSFAKSAIGASTGVGDEALSQALRAGKTGGKTAQDFTKAMRGESNMDDVLQMAKQNLEAMGQQKQAAYRQGMAGVKADKTVLNLGNIDKSIDDAIGMATYKGQIKNDKAATALSEIKGEVDNWKSLDPAEFHTPEGLDALKQKIGGILEEIPYEQKTARSAAGKVYDAVRSEINAQSPEYSKVMKGYSEASDTIKEIERALSQGQKASADTAMRKLQSLMRNNVNTNYGQRAKLAQEMIAAGGQDFMPALAGQALNDFTPRGIQRAGVGTGSAGLALTGNIPAAVALPFVSSPRLMGEAFYGAGKVAGAVNPAIIEALRKAGYRSAPIAASSE